MGNTAQELVHQPASAEQTLFSGWRWSALLVMIVGFAVLIGVSLEAYEAAPPIPDKVETAEGERLFTGQDIREGQQVFLKYGLMENGTLWGHGAYLGPDFSAEYLHYLTVAAREERAQALYHKTYSALSPEQRAVVDAEVVVMLKGNRYNPDTRALTFTAAEASANQQQIAHWTRYFSEPTRNGGLKANFIADPEELRKLTAFFAWTAWASVANRPGTGHSYTNNFPYDPAAGNLPTGAAVLWSALSLVALLGGIGIVLLAFGKFDYLGWADVGRHATPRLALGTATPAQQAVVKYFVIVTLLLLVQTLVGGATAHYRADPGSFYGFDLSALFPSNLMRTWHIQLTVFWIATAYVAGGLFLASSLGGRDPERQTQGINLLFAALVLVVVGSLLGEWAGMMNWIPRLWYWFGDQGWEYLELGRAWQVLLALGLFFWLFLMVRSLWPARKDPEYREFALLFLIAATAIPVFYLPAFFFGSTTHYTVVETWRFWIIHLWVEGFFEFFLTVMVAMILTQLGIVSRSTALRVIYLDAILYFAGGVIGTGHHWYWTGQREITMALGAVFSALEVVPLTLLTLDAWDFIKLTRGERGALPHQWTFYFLMAVGFWNFVGAGIFGFLINLPIVSYFEIGTLLTPNHGHAAMMGVFGMLALALGVFVMRQVLDEARWAEVEKYVRVSFWGLNAGLAGMLAMNLFPNGVRQLVDAVENGYWHARSAAFMGEELTRLIEWLRTPADLIFIVFGVIPLVIAAFKAWRSVTVVPRREPVSVR